jgi:hypothetical protein
LLLAFGGPFSRDDLLKRALQGFIIVRADFLGGFDEPLGLLRIVGL